MVHVYFLSLVFPPLILTVCFHTFFPQKEKKKEKEENLLRKKSRQYAIQYMERYQHLQHTPQTPYSHFKNAGYLPHQFPNVPIGSVGKPYRVAVRVIREKGHQDSDEAHHPEGGNAAINSVGTSSAETLISQIPPNFCSVWHLQMADERMQLGEIVGAAMAQGCGVYVVDCGYEEASLGLNDDMLSHYVRHSALVPNPTLRSLVGRGGLGGIGPSFGIEDNLGKSSAVPSVSASSLQTGSGVGGGTNNFSLRPQSEGVIVAFVSKLLAESPGETIQFSFFAMSAIDRPVTDLLLPLLSVADAATVAATLDEKATGTLSSVSITTKQQFNELMSTITSSNSFRMARPRLSFGFVFMFKRIPHVFLLLNQHHQRDAIATLEGQFALLPPFLQVKLREADAANNRVGTNGNRNNNDNTGYLTNGQAAVLDPYTQNPSADFYGSSSHLQHGDSSFVASSTIGSASFTQDTGLSKDMSALQTLQHLNGGLDYKAAQARRLLAANVLAHIRRTMALHYIKQNRVEFFKPMYVVRLGGDQKGRDPLGMLPFLLARGSPNPTIAPNGLDYRVLTNPISRPSHGDASPWNAGDLGPLDAKQRQLHLSLEAQQQLAYQQQVLMQQQQLQAAAAQAGLTNSVLIFKPAAAMPPMTDNNAASQPPMMGLNTTMQRSTASISSTLFQQPTQRALFPNPNTPIEPLMALAPNTSAYVSGSFLPGGGNPFTSASYSSPTAASAKDVRHLSRLTQSPTQIPYALLQNPDNHPKGAETTVAKPQFETIEVGIGEDMPSAMFRSNIGAGEDGPTSTSTSAPPAVKPFLVTDSTISDTVAYLEKEKHVCRNAHRELQKDIHDVFKRIEDLTHRHKLVREALKRKTAEAQRIQKDVEGSHQRTLQIEKVVADLEAEIKRAEDIVAYEDKSAHDDQTEEARREREQIEKKAAHAAKKAALADEHRSRMFQENAEAKKIEEELQRQISAEERLAESHQSKLRRELLSLDAELNAVSDMINEKGNTIRSSQEKVAESTFKKNHLETVLYQLRAQAVERDNVQSQLSQCAFEKQEAALKVAALEKGLAAYDKIMAEEAASVTKEVNATLDRTETRKDKKSSAALSTLLHSPSPAPTPSLLVGTTNFRLSNPPTPQISHAISRTNSYSRQPDPNTVGLESTTPFKAGQAEADAAIISTRITALSELRRTAATLKSLVTKQSRTMALRRSRAAKYKAFVIEEHESASRTAIEAAWRDGLGQIAAQIPESHQLSHRLFEMMLVDSIATSCKSQQVQPQSPPPILSSALKGTHSGTAPAADPSLSAGPKRIRFVDADMDLSTANLRLASLKQEVQRKVRERLDLVAMLESLRSDAQRLSSDSETIDLEAQMRSEIEGVARLRAAHHEVFERQEEELQRRRRVYMSMFVEFLPQIKKELSNFANADQIEAQHRPLQPRGRDVAALIQGAVAETVAQKNQERNRSQYQSQGPRYLTDTAASKARKKDMLIDATYAETIYSTNDERKVSEDLESHRASATESLNTSAEGVSDLENTRSKSIVASNRFASIAIKHIHGHHARTNLNPAGLNGQASVTADRGDLVCQKYWEWREALTESKILKAKVEEDEEEVAKLETSVGRLSEKVAEMRRRLGVLTAERERYSQDRDQWEKGLSDAARDFTDNDIKQGLMSHNDEKDHHTAMEELRHKLEGLEALCAAVVSEIALGDKDNQKLVEEIEAISQEVETLSSLDRRRASIRTEIALVESHAKLKYEQEAETERNLLKESRKKAKPVASPHFEDSDHHQAREHENFKNLGTAEDAATIPLSMSDYRGLDLSIGNAIPSASPHMPIPSLTPERRRLYDKAFRPMRDIPTVAEAAAAGAIYSATAATMKDATAVQADGFITVNKQPPRDDPSNVDAGNDTTGSEVMTQHSEISVGYDRLRAAHAALPKSIQLRIARHNQRRLLSLNDSASMSGADSIEDASTVGSLSAISSNIIMYNPVASHPATDTYDNRSLDDSASPLSKLLARLEKTEAKASKSADATNAFLAKHNMALPSISVERARDASLLPSPAVWKGADETPIRIGNNASTTNGQSGSKYAALREVLTSHIEALSKDD